MDELAHGETVNVGNYIVVKRQNFQKLCKIMQDGTFTLNKKQIEVNEIVGKPYWTTFKMIASKNGKNNMSLEIADRAETWEDLRKGLISGVDNRSITDDGTSQKLSKAEILDLRESGKSSKEIVGCLIENSSSFISKTEYSQEKYIKKKENKYYSYLTILKPNISLLQEIYFKQDHGKINCLRMDTLSQILSYCDVKADANYLLYDAGSAGLAPAAMLNRIGRLNKGSLINIHPGNQANLTLVNAMNFPDEQLNRLQSVNLYTLLRLYHQGMEAVEAELAKKYVASRKLADKLKRTISKDLKCNIIIKKPRLEGDPESLEHPIDDKEEDNVKNNEMFENLNNEEEKNRYNKEEKNVRTDEGNDKNNTVDTNENKELKPEESIIIDSMVFKRPKWLNETNKVVDYLKITKVEGLAIIAREHPLNLINALLPFLHTSKPFVIYHCYREPLQETYVALKQRRDVINLKLFSNFCRGYQVLLNRTHPEIMTNDLGGYLLSGYLIN